MRQESSDLYVADTRGVLTVTLYDRDGKEFPIDEWTSAEPGSRETWGRQQRVANTAVGEFRVSTVWLLGIDHNYDDGPPLIFETMVFGEPYDNELMRYATEEAAMRGHLSVLDNLRAGRAPFGII